MLLLLISWYGHQIGVSHPNTWRRPRAPDHVVRDDDLRLARFRQVEAINSLHLVTGSSELEPCMFMDVRNPLPLQISQR